MSNLVYPTQSLWQFLVNDEPEPDYDFRGDTPVYPGRLAIVIADISEDDEYELRAA